MSDQIYIQPLTFVPGPQAVEGEAVRLAGGMVYAREFAVMLRRDGQVIERHIATKSTIDNLLATLPDAYRTLNRQGLSGDFFSFYLCDLMLKVNGKGGQPVYIKVAGQNSGRCTPR